MMVVMVMMMMVVVMVMMMVMMMMMTTMMMTLMSRKCGGNSNDPARFTIVNNKWEYFTIRLKVMFLLRGKQPCGISGIH